MSRLNDLKLTNSLSDVAGLLLFKPAGLSYILFKVPDAAKYTTFSIPKRSGGTRTIEAPIDSLKLVQQRLSDLLQDCVDEINETKGRKDRVAHGFKRKRSIRSNAKQHRNRRYVFNVDLEDFSPSINFGRVRGFFIKDSNFGLCPAVATVIAQIVCHQNALPQGSPCSPVISNLVAHVLDMHLVKFASHAGCTYSRYADALTFSTNLKTFPSSIAELSAVGSHVWNVGSGLQRMVSHSGFTINPAKTRMQYRTSRQEVTGLVVNKRVNTKHEYQHAVRAMVHKFLQTGLFQFRAPFGQGGTQAVEGTANQLHGMLGFIDSIDLVLCPINNLTN